jgi:CRISPR-associated protein Cas8c/Csd1, subtype I-C/DVULG
MGWMQALYETYEAFQDYAGKTDTDDAVLLPIAHSTAQAQIEILLDVSGVFLTAKKVEKEDAVTIIPVTENSNTRSSGITPHPLCDKLCYVAGDYEKFVQQEKTKAGKKEKTDRAYFDDYIEALKQWCEMPNVNEKVKVIYSYLAKESVVQDLVNTKIIELSEQGKMTNAKIMNIAQSDVFIRFKIEKMGDWAYIQETWKDKNLFDNFIEYYLGNINRKAYCYVLGKEVASSEKHPAKIRNSGDKAKLISSNDNTGYTYRGRFEEAGEAATVSFEVSQKAHNALRWLIQKQGIRNGSAYIVAWAVDGSYLPGITKSSEDLIKESEFISKDESIEEEDQELYTADVYAKRLKKAIWGNESNLNTKAKVVVLCVDTADGSGQGRLAITFYKELKKSALLYNIENWHKTLYRTVTEWKNETARCRYIGAPSPWEIAKAAYGVERGNFIDVDDKVEKKCIERILPCIIDGKKIPKDIVKAAIINAGCPVAFSSKNWNQILMNTCALIMKFENDRIRKEKWDMSLNKTCMDRSYLFGRLLAIADSVEYQTFVKGEDRETNAKRYMTAFVKKPEKYWAVIYSRLLPYFNKLKPGTKIFFEHEIENIMELLSESEAGRDKEDNNLYNNNALDGLYLLGFYHQRKALRVKSEIQNNIEDESEENNND